MEETDPGDHTAASKDKSTTQRNVDEFVSNIDALVSKVNRAEDTVNVLRRSIRKHTSLVTVPPRDLNSPELKPLRDQFEVALRQLQDAQDILAYGLKRKLAQHQEREKMRHIAQTDPNWRAKQDNSQGAE